MRASGDEGMDGCLWIVADHQRFSDEHCIGPGLCIVEQVLRSAHTGLGDLRDVIGNHGCNLRELVTRLNRTGARLIFSPCCSPSTNSTIWPPA